MSHCHKRIGEAYFQTPRNTITAFIHLLAVLEQNPHADWHELLGAVSVAVDNGDSLTLLENSAADEEDELASFKL
jgi:hypothetical protein